MVALCCSASCWPAKVARGGGRESGGHVDPMAGGGLLQSLRDGAARVNLLSGASSSFRGGSFLSSWIVRTPFLWSVAVPQLFDVRHRCPPRLALVAWEKDLVLLAMLCHGDGS
jgi:hypothetical protein